MEIYNKVRIGIDVGGTHTKAVAIDNNTHKIIGKSSVKTTHDHKDGVSKGVIDVFTACLKENNIRPQDVVFVAYSTTQATNALLEGDVSHVGVIGITGRGIEGFLAKKQFNLKDINLAEGKKIKISTVTIDKKDVNRQNIIDKIKELKELGAETLVASMAFGVDDMTKEVMVADIAKEIGVNVTVASEISKLYGLTRRTKTAAINSSILKKMIDTSNSTEYSVRKANVNVPLMIMRGDGGAMDISEMRKRPVLTMLSGPAASVMGALMYLRVSNGIYFEVGGTSTNIGVIKNGRPEIDYAVVDGNKTYINSLDIQVLGVGGGSMLRANEKGIIDVGPRSAHIAGMDYAAFTAEDEIVEPKLEFFAPKEGDLKDYVCIKLKNGKRITITNTCAANVLGLITKEDFSFGSVNSARKAMKPLADYMHMTVEEVAEQIMRKSFNKIRAVVLEFLDKYKLDKNHISLIGVGGGTSSLIKYFSKNIGIKYTIADNAEIISSIGAALAMVRDTVERVVPSPTPDDIKNIRNEAINKAIQSGASLDTIDVHIEIDSNKSRLIAIATGSTEVKSTDLLKECTIDEAKIIAAEDMDISVDNTVLLQSTDNYYIFSKKNNPFAPVRIVDKKGFIKVQRNSAVAYRCKAKDYKSIIKTLWEELAVYKTDSILRPDFYLCIGPRIADFESGSADMDQIIMLMEVSLDMVCDSEEILIVGAKNEI